MVEHYGFEEELLAKVERKYLPKHESRSVEVVETKYDLFLNKKAPAPGKQKQKQQRRQQLEEYFVNVSTHMDWCSTPMARMAARSLSRVITDLAKPSSRT